MLKQREDAKIVQELEREEVAESARNYNVQMKQMYKVQDKVEMMTDRIEQLEDLLK